MADLLVHLHVYYHDQVDYFIEKLGNITCVEWDLIVTYSRWDDESAEKFRVFKPEVRFMKVDNFGYDIWPFIKVIKSIRLEEYKYIVKLHTKRSVGRMQFAGKSLKGFGWRNALVDGILYSKDYFRSLIDIFEKDKTVGMISNLYTHCDKDPYEEFARKELSRLNLYKLERNICYGTMFIARSEVLKILQSDLIGEDSFKENAVSGSTFGPSHLYERIFSHLSVNYGYRHLGLIPEGKGYLKRKLIKGVEPVVKFLFCLERKGPERRKFIRILGISFYLEKKGKYEVPENSVIQ